MRKILLYIFLFLPALAFGQAVKTAAVPYTKGTTPYTPNTASSSEIRIDTSCSCLYWWDRDNLTWIRQRPGADVISGSVPPAYTPRDNQSLFAVNADSELFYWDGSVWNQIGGGGGLGGIYESSDTVPDGTVATLEDDFAISGGNISSITISTGDTLGGEYFSNFNGASISFRDTTGNSSLEFSGGGAVFNFDDGSTDRLLINDRDARYGADYSATYTDRSIPDVGYVDSAAAAVVSLPSPEVAIGDDTGLTSSSNFTYETGQLTLGGVLPIVEASDEGASSTTSGGLLRLANFDGAAIASGHRLGAVDFMAETGAGTTVGASMEVFARSLWTGSNARSRMVFNTAGNGSLTATPRLTLQEGEVSIHDGSALYLYTTGDADLGGLEVGDSTFYIFPPSASGEIYLQGKFSVTGGQFDISADFDNFYISFLGSNINLGNTSGSTKTFTGFQPSTAGDRVLFLYHTGGNDIVFADEDAASDPENRFDLGGADYTMTAETGIVMTYNQLGERWNIIATSGGGSSPGSSAETNALATIRPAQLAAQTDNWNPTGYSTTVTQVIELSGDGSFRFITGMEAATRDGVLKTLSNTDSNCVGIAKQHTDSDAENRFDINKDVILFPGMEATFRYDSVGQRWKLFSSSEASISYAAKYDVKATNFGSVTSDNFYYDGQNAGGSIARLSAGGVAGDKLSTTYFTTSTAAGASPCLISYSGVANLAATAYIRTSARVRFEDLSTAAQDYDFTLGYLAYSGIDTTARTKRGFALTYTHSENSGSFSLWTHNGTTGTSAGIGSAITADTWYNLELVYYPHGEVAAWINGTRYSTTTTVPTTGVLSYMQMMDKDNGTTASIQYFTSLEDRVILVSE